MNNYIQLITKNDIESNPDAIGKNLAQLATALEETRTDLNEIKNRDFWKRLTNNINRDLVEAMIKQNDTISSFFIIVQSIVFLSMNNLAVLGTIMESLDESEKTNGIRDNRYINMAKDYLDEAIKSAKKVSLNEKEIERIKINLDKVVLKQEAHAKWTLSLQKAIENNMELKSYNGGYTNSKIEQLEIKIKLLKKGLFISFFLVMICIILILIVIL